MKRLSFIPLLFLFTLFCKGQSNEVKINNDFFLLGTLDDYMGRETYKHIANRVETYNQNNKSLVVYIHSTFKDKYPDLIFKTNSNNNDRLDLLSELLAQKMNDFYVFKSQGGGAYIGKEDFKTLRMDTIMNNKSLFNTYFDSTFIGTVKKEIFKNDIERLSFITGAYLRFGGKKDSIYSITMYNSTSKAKVLTEQLKELKCTNVEYIIKEGYIPCGHIVFFTPTDELKKYFEDIDKKVSKIIE